MTGAATYEVLFRVVIVSAIMTFTGLPVAVEGKFPVTSTGAAANALILTGRWRRWLFSGLHRLDFTDWMRTRPLRDIMMWLTLLGGLGVSVTGVYLAIRRIRSDVTLLVRFIVRPRAAAKSISRETEMIDA
jgi:hypothetical protein